MNPRLTYISIFGALVAVACLLLWAARTHRLGEDRIPEILGERFSSVLSREYPPIQTGRESIRTIAEELQTAYPDIKEIVVGQVIAGRGLVILYPPGYSFDHPGPVSETMPDAYVVTVRSPRDHRRAGTVFFRYDRWRTTLFNVALLAVLVLMVLVAAMWYLQLQSAGMQVRRTRIALEERDRQLIHLERLAMAGRATAALLHDLKKPVINIRDEIANLPDGPEREALREETAFFFDLLRDWQLERFVAPDREVGEFLDLQEAVERSLRFASFARGAVEVEVDLPEHLPDVLGQQQRMVQVFGNLILNAYQAMRGEGELRIVGREGRSGGGRWVQVDFADTGPGIPSDRRERVFEAFVTGGQEEGSTGLGLYIVRSIITEMGGKVWLNAGEIEGAVFHVQLPLSSPETAG